MSAYEYPRLSRSDIITALKDAQIASVTETDLKTPTSDFVSELYTRILIYLDALDEYVLLKTLVPLLALHSILPSILKLFV